MGKTKNMSDLMAIKQFAKTVGVPQDTLRYYDNVGIFKPYLTDESNGYRYYSPSQITKAKMIRTFVELGVNIVAIKGMMDNPSPENLMTMFHRQLVVARGFMDYFATIYSALLMHMELLNEGLSANEAEITVEIRPETKIILSEENDYTATARFYGELAKFYKRKTKPKINQIFPMGGFFSDISEFSSRPSLPSKFYSLDSKGHDVKEYGLYLIGYARGYYGDVGDLPDRMKAYASEKGIEFDGPVYNVFLLDEMCIDEPDKYLAQVSASVSWIDPADEWSHNWIPNFKKLRGAKP